MKKLILTASVLTLSSASYAQSMFSDNIQMKHLQGLNAQLEADNNKRVSSQLDYAFDSGVLLGVSGDYSLDKPNKGVISTELSAGYLFKLSENSWLLPSVSYTVGKDDHSINGAVDQHNHLAQISDLKAGSYGIEYGRTIGGAGFISAGYRFSASDYNAHYTSALSGEEFDRVYPPYTRSESVDNHKSTITAGYHFPNVTLKASLTHDRFERQSNEDVGFDWMVRPHDKGHQNQFAIKATYTGFDNLQPYLQYTYTDDVKINSLPNMLVDKQKVSLGVHYRF